MPSSWPSFPTSVCPLGFTWLSLGAPSFYVTVSEGGTLVAAGPVRAGVHCQEGQAALHVDHGRLPHPAQVRWVAGGRQAGLAGAGKGAFIAFLPAAARLDELTLPWLVGQG
jgi:hypothetical protein